MQVGNAVTDNYYDNLGTVTYWWSHAMISDKTYKQLINTCDFRRQKNSDQCESLYSYAMDKEFGNIDQYNIYAPPCNNSDGSTRTSTRQTAMHLPHRPVYIIQIFRQVSSIICTLIRMYLQIIPFFTFALKMFRQISGYDPCTEKYAELYYNRPDVQKALHANITKIPYKWTACRWSIQLQHFYFSFLFQVEGVLTFILVNSWLICVIIWWYKLQWGFKSKLERHRCIGSSYLQGYDNCRFKDLGFQVYYLTSIITVLFIIKLFPRMTLIHDYNLLNWCIYVCTYIYSGDVDSVVPVTATRYSLAQLKLATKIPWYPWYTKKQVSKILIWYCKIE